MPCGSTIDDAHAEVHVVAIRRRGLEQEAAVLRILREAELDVALVVEELVDVLQRHICGITTPHEVLKAVGAIDAGPEGQRLDGLVVVGRARARCDRIP